MDVGDAASIVTACGLQRLHRKIGKGRFCNGVWLCRRDGSADDFALKLLPHANGEGQSTALAQRIRSEGSTLSSFRHPNIVACIDFGTSSDQDFIVLEYCHGGDLQDYLQQHGGMVPQSCAPRLMRQLVRAMDYLHGFNPPYLHGDIKPSNLLLTSDNIWETTVKLSDFGFAQPITPETAAINVLEYEVGGTPHYMAPEIVLHGKITPQADVWSAGVVLYQMVTGELPLQANSLGQLKDQMRALGYAPLRLPPAHYADVPFLCLDALAQMLLRAPEQRISSGRLVHYAYFTDHDKLLRPLTAVAAAAVAAAATNTTTTPTVAVTAPETILDNINAIVYIAELGMQTCRVDVMFWALDKLACCQDCSSTSVPGIVHGALKRNTEPQQCSSPLSPATAFGEGCAQVGGAPDSEVSAAFTRLQSQMEPFLGSMPIPHGEHWKVKVEAFIAQLLMRCATGRPKMGTAQAPDVVAIAHTLLTNGLLEPSKHVSSPLTPVNAVPSVWQLMWHHLPHAIRYVGLQEPQVPERLVVSLSPRYWRWMTSLTDKSPFSLVGEFSGAVSALCSVDPGSLRQRGAPTHFVFAHPCEYRAVQDAAAHGCLRDDRLWFLAMGGFVYLDLQDAPKAVAVGLPMWTDNLCCPDTSDNRHPQMPHAGKGAMRHFAFMYPKPMPDDALEGLVAAQRMQPVHWRPLVAAGAKDMAWLMPQEGPDNKWGAFAIRMHDGRGAIFRVAAIW